MNLTNKNFLLWKEPKESEITLFVLEANNDSGDSVWISPFTGGGKAFGIAKKTTFLIDELSNLELSFSNANKAIKSTTKNSHLEKVAQAVSNLKDGPLEKVVLARTKALSGEPKPIKWFKRLALQYNDACVFLFHTKESGTWMGATPERLLFTEDHFATAMSLAGTRKAETLGDWGEKEKEEQQLVTDEIVSVYKSAGLTEIECSEVQTKKAGPIEHLFTEVQGRMPTKLAAVELAQNLHPTPAVGGLPKNEAIKYIADNENFDRNYYAGFFGIREGKGARFYVNLRSMQLFKNGLVLYAGGGITASSNPQAEWEETERKLQTLLQIIED